MQGSTMKAQAVDDHGDERLAMGNLEVALLGDDGNDHGRQPNSRQMPVTRPR